MASRNGNGAEDPSKRQAILDRAIEAFAESGYRGADVQVIADGAGVGKGTVYRYFQSKEELFWAATFEVMLRLEKTLFTSMDRVEGTCAKIRASAIAYAKFFQSNPQFLEVFIQERAEFRGTGPESHREYHQKLIHRFEEILQKGIDAGELRPIDTYRTTHTLGSLLYGIVVLGCHLSPISGVEMAEHAVDILLRGLRADVASQRESPCSIGSK
jgi:AcrR family transcriptional regulator